MSFNQSVRAYACPSRISKLVFDKVYDALQNDELQSDYTKWKFGIKYKTNRLIEIYKKPTELNQP